MGGEFPSSAAAPAGGRWSDGPPRGFAAAEFEGRVARAQRLMARERVASLLLTTEPEVRYFSGFHTRFWASPSRPWFLAVPADGKPVAVVPGIGAPLMGRTWVDDIRTWESPAPDDEGVSLLADTLRGLCPSDGRIGVPMGPETVLRMPLADYGRLRSMLPGRALVDATGIVRALQMVKSEAEVRKVARSCAIASEMFGGLPGLFSSGQPLGRLAGAITQRLAELGADEVPYLSGASAPGGYEDVISPLGERVPAPGDVLMVDVGAVRDGYFCDFDRNFAVGDPGDDARRAHAALWRATEAGIAAARPGATCAGVFGAMRASIAGAGFEAGNVGRMGHGIGMRLTEWLSISARDGTRLEPGMALAIEPCLEIAPGRGMVHEENVVVRDGEAELLTCRTPEELPGVT